MGIFSSVGSFLTSSSAGSLVSDTLVSSAVGAVAGGAATALSGGDFKDGAKAGALAGAAYGAFDNLTAESFGQAGGQSGGGDSTAVQQKVSTPTESNGLLSRVGDVWGGMDSGDKQLLGNVVAGAGKGWFAQQQAKEKEEEAQRDWERRRSKFQPSIKDTIIAQQMPSLGRRQR